MVALALAVAGLQPALGASCGAGVAARSLATLILCTSVGPSAMPITGTAIHMLMSGISFEQPSAPWMCSARRTTSCSTSAVCTLTAAI